MTCRNCHHYDLKAVQDKAGRVRKDRVAKCLWLSTVIWPDSVPNHRPQTCWMVPYDGANCPCFVKREADHEA